MSKEEICHVATTSFRNELGSKQYPYEDGRYWLFTSKLCPFAHRTEIARAYKGLTGVIGLTIAGPIQTENGWNLKARTVTRTSSACPIEGADYLPAIYELASPGYSGRVSVPILFDTKTNTIVNNESAEIIRMLDSFPTKDLRTSSIYESFTEDQLIEIESVCHFLDTELISSIYKAGFALEQDVYEENANRVFSALEALNTRLRNNGPYLIANDITAADIHAFPHLTRFDAIYHGLYGLNTKYIRDYSFLAAYLNRLSKTTGFGDTLDIETSKIGYYRSWNQPTDGAFVPIGPAVHSDSGVARAA